MAKSDDKQNDDEDPVVAEYGVHLTDALVEKLMLIQYPNRHHREAYTEANGARPSEIRIKPKAGLVEVDVPANVHVNFDKEKAVRWGEAMRVSAAEKAGGSQGFAGGFGIGASSVAASSGTSRAGGGMTGTAEESEMDHTQEMLLADFETANAQGRVLSKQTLGGQIEPITDEQPIYMIGAFKDNELHLSHIDSVVQLRPQFHHVDAASEQERSSAKSQRDAANPPRAQEARAVHMTIKSVDGEDFDMTQTMKTLKEIQEEKWKRMDYLDENSNEAWEGYGTKLCAKHTESAPKLQSAMNNVQYLDAISAPKVEVTAAGNSAPLQKTEAQAAGASQRDGELIIDDVDDDEDMDSYEQKQ